MRTLVSSIASVMLVLTGFQAANSTSIFDENYAFLEESNFEFDHVKVNGFLGIEWEDLLEDEKRFYIDDAEPHSESGYTGDAYDDWGFLYVSDDDFQTFQEILVFSRETCVATDDGRPDRSPDDDNNFHSSLHCYSEELNIGGEKVRFELIHEFVGSFFRTTVIPMSGNTLSSSLDFAWVGNLGSDSDASLSVNRQSSNYRFVILSDESESDPVLGFRSQQDFNTIDPSSDQPTLDPYTSGDDIGFIFDDVITSERGITVENFLVDYDISNPGTTLPAAITLAEQLIDVPFGYCIAGVDDATPDATNQCTDKYWAAVNSVLVKPERVDQSGFPGLFVNLSVNAQNDSSDASGPDSPIFPLQSVDAGQKDDAVDEFGFLHLTDGNTTRMLALDDFATCEAKADGVSTKAVSNQGVEQFVIDCTGGNVAFGGDQLDVRALIEIQGSSIAWQVDLSSTSTTAPISVWVEGLLGLDNDTTSSPMVWEYTDSGNTSNVNQLIVSAESEDDDIPVTVWEFNTPSTVTTRDVTVENSTPTVGSGEFGVLSESKIIDSEVESFRFEMTTIDSYKDFEVHAVELAEEFLSDGYFGFCLPIVEQPLKPIMNDQCIELNNNALNFREVEKRTQWDVDRLNDAQEGESYVFTDIGIRGGVTLDARVTVEEIVGLQSDIVADVDDGEQARQSDWNDQFMRIDTVAEIDYPEGTPKESYAQILVEFLNKDGTSATLSDVYLNTYDIDEFQYFEVEGFDSYRLSDTTSLTVARTEGESLRFKSGSESASSSANNIDDRSNYRIEVYFERANEVRLRVGTDVTNLPSDFDNDDAIANYYLDFSSGPFWVSTTNVQATAPKLQRNFAKPAPAFSAPIGFSGPVVTSVDPVELNAGESFELNGQRLDLVESVVVGEKELEIVESSESKLTVSTDSNLPAATYELKIKWSGGELAFSPELTVLQKGSSENLEFSYWTKKVSETEVKMYAKNVIGEGKIQFFEDGEEVAWIRAETEDDPKLTSAIGSYYLVRTIALEPGKNRLEIRVDGERVRFNTYVP